MRVSNPMPAACTFLCIVLLVMACRKDRGPQRTAGSGVQLLKMTDGDRVYNRFEYSAEGNVQKHLYYIGYGPDTLADHYEYRAGRLHKVTTPGNEYLSFHYTGSQLARKDFYNAAGQRTFSWSYTYSNNRLMEELGSELFEGGWYLSHRREHTYDGEGNLVRTDRYLDPDHDGAFEKTGSVEYLDYTVHPDPYGAFVQQWNLPSLRNVPRLSQKAVHYDGLGYEEWTDEHSYEYNGQGYPLKQVTVSYNPSRNVIRRSTVLYTYNR